MVYIPLPGETPLEPPPLIPVTEELLLLRKQTVAFIRANQTLIQLIPRQLQDATDGGHFFTDLPPRPTQEFRLIPQADGMAARVDDNGESNQYPFILLGAWNCTMHELDFWEDPDTEMRWEIESFVHYNAYERKARVTAYGEQPFSYRDQ